MSPEYGQTQGAAHPFGRQEHFLEWSSFCRAYLFKEWTQA